MKYAVAAVLAAAAGASAQYGGNATVVTEVVDSYVTYCPGATQFVHGGKTYTATEPTSITLECPCTITRPVVTSSAVVCNNCGGGYNNSTGPIVVKPTGAPPVSPPGATVAPPAGSGPAPSTVPTAAAGKVAALSGAGLAGVIGLAAFVL